MKILITGGHLTPALAFIQYLKTNKTNDKVIFVGREYSQEKNKQVSVEKKVITKLGIKFIPFSSSKLSSPNLLEKLKALPKLVVATFKAVGIINNTKPNIFLSFGGYLAVPVAFACWIMRVAVVTHEQTRTAGEANKIVAKVAKKIAVSYKETKKLFPKDRTVVTGNLIRTNIINTKGKKPTWFKQLLTKNSLPLLYITGGSQGSEVINHNISQVANTLTKDWLVIHQCGVASKQRNYRKELNKVRSHISAKTRSNYYVREWISESELAWIYSHARVIVSRAGANTTQEIAVKKIASVLIPLPFSHHDEQFKNAQALAKKKQAILLEQKLLTPQTLLQSIQTANKYHRRYRRNLESFAKPQDSAKKLYKLLSNE